MSPRCPRPDPQLSVETREVRGALGELPPRQRTVLDRHVDEFSSQGIADKLGISVRTVRVHLFKARASLRGICGQTEERDGRPGLLPAAVCPALGVLPLNMDEGEEEEAVAAIRRAEKELLRHFEVDHATRSRILAALWEVAVRQTWSVEGEA
ncbi:sigma-70 family RNA polymerase sigma factor [Streptomyces brevispora]|uniref:RNA polymerase sigma factor n=1 Tax=Streptomyces brevispora TaxID=887462 RepID=UPI002E37E8BC|nr:sigma-70 family RNA polymerase sigma factor [Streptomyces brevispora]